MVGGGAELKFIVLGSKIQHHNIKTATLRYSFGMM